MTVEVAQPVFERGPIGKYVYTLKSFLTRPTQTFRSIGLPRKVSGPLVFAIVTHWLGSAIAYLEHAVWTGMIDDRAQRLFHVLDRVSDVDSPGKSAMLQEVREKLFHWFWGVGSVLVDPFQTIFTLLIQSLMIWIGARILITPGRDVAVSEIPYESALAIVSYAMAPALLLGVPLVGTVLVWGFSFALIVIGVREVYRIDRGRAVVIALFPQIVMFVILMAGLVFLATGLLRLFSNFF